MFKGTRIELQRLCDLHHTLPTSYVLEGVTKEGDRPQYTSHATEIWKGRYRDEEVELKILKVSPQDPKILAFKSVSVPHMISRSFVVVLTDDTAVSQGSSIDKTI